MTRTSKPDYLYKQSKSQNWWLRLQFNGEAAKFAGTKEFRASMKTTDKQEAELRAAPLIYWHNNILALAQGKNVQPLKIEDKKIPMGEHWIDGIKVIATATDVIKILDDGKITQTKQDEGIRLNIMPPIKETNPDDRIIENWITQKNVSKYLAMEGRKVWAIFKKITNNKPLKQCERDDGRKLVAHLSGQGDKMATVRKKISHLNAAINIAINDGKLKFNPFTAVAPAPSDSVVRIPFSSDDMRLCNTNLSNLSDSDQILWRMLALTGMRLDEAFQIDEEFEENGVRYVIAGTKTPQSRRRVPLPIPLLPVLPTKISGRLFDGTTKAAGKRLRTWLKGIGISYDPIKKTGDLRKVPHSLRHRAKDQLRAAGCPLDIQYQLLGHEETTVASGYGVGYPVNILADWMIKIGEGETRTESDAHPPSMFNDDRRLIDLD